MFATILKPPPLIYGTQATHAPFTKDAECSVNSQAAVVAVANRIGGHDTNLEADFTAMLTGKHVDTIVQSTIRCNATLAKTGEASVAAMLDRPTIKSMYVDWLDKTLRALEAPPESVTSENLGLHFKGQVLALEAAKRFGKKKNFNLDPRGGPQAFVFYGKSGTGKTYLAEQIAKMMGKRVKVFDMANIEMDTLLGAPKGLAGGRGQLAEFIDAHPDAICIFDEFEKGDKSLPNKFLTILDGTINDPQNNKRISTDRATFIFTSNTGSDTVDRFRDAEKTMGDVARHALSQTSVTNPFLLDSPFFNRITAGNMVPFFSPNKVGMQAFVEKKLVEFAKAVQKDHHRLSWSPAVVQAYTAMCMHDRRSGGGMRVCGTFLKDQVEGLLEAFFEMQPDGSACPMVLWRDISPQDGVIVDPGVEIAVPKLGCDVKPVARTAPAPVPNAPPPTPVYSSTKTKDTANDQKKGKKKDGKEKEKAKKEKKEEKPPVATEADQANALMKEQAVAQEAAQETATWSSAMQQLKQLAEALSEVTREQVTEEQIVYVKAVAIAAAVALVLFGPATLLLAPFKLLSLSVVLFVIWDYLPKAVVNLVLWIIEHPMAIMGAGGLWILWVFFSCWGGGEAARRSTAGSVIANVSPVANVCYVSPGDAAYQRGKAK